MTQYEADWTVPERYDAGLAINSVLAEYPSVSLQTVGEPTVLNRYTEDGEVNVRYRFRLSGEKVSDEFAENLMFYHGVLLRRL